MAASSMFDMLDCGLAIFYGNFIFFANSSPRVRNLFLKFVPITLPMPFNVPS